MVRFDTPHDHTRRLRHAVFDQNWLCQVDLDTVVNGCDSLDSRNADEKWADTNMRSVEYARVLLSWLRKPPYLCPCYSRSACRIVASIISRQGQERVPRLSKLLRRNRSALDRLRQSDYTSHFRRIPQSKHRAIASHNRRAQFTAP